MTRNLLEEKLNQKQILISDGGMGTELEKLGVISDSGLWSSDALLHHPDAVYDIHRAYLEAGADIITTATYQANPLFLKKRLSISTDKPLITKAVEIARRAKSDFGRDHPKAQIPLIAGSVGPYGAYLNDGSEYTGNYHLSKNEFKAFHLPHLRLLKQAGVDFFAFETVPNFTEVQALVELLRDNFKGVSAWVSFSVNHAFDLCDGTNLEQAISYLNQVPQISAVGVNCTDIENIAPILDRIKPLCQKPIVVYPNNGDDYDSSLGKWVSSSNKPKFTDITSNWIDKGAQIIGGCCRTTPDDIHDIFTVVHSDRVFA